VLFLDQVSKYLVRTYLAPPSGPIDLIGPYLRLNLVHNPGAAFGMLPGNRVIFMTVSVAFLVGVAVYWVRVHPTRRLLVWALALVAAGAGGNLIDRAVFGLVTDFVQVPFGFPVFNVADTAIVVGVSMLVWWVLFGPADHAAAHPANDGDAVAADQAE
jgi:signal peptidase II